MCSGFKCLAIPGTCLTLLASNAFATAYTVDLDTDNFVAMGGSSTASKSGGLRYVLNQILNNQAQGTTGTHTIGFSVATVTLSIACLLNNGFGFTSTYSPQAGGHLITQEV